MVFFFFFSIHFYGRVYRGRRLSAFVTRSANARARAPIDFRLSDDSPGPFAVRDGYFPWLLIYSLVGFRSARVTSRARRDLLRDSHLRARAFCSFAGLELNCRRARMEGNGFINLIVVSSGRLFIFWKGYFFIFRVFCYQWFP